MGNKLIPKIRFSNFSDNWEEKNLGELSNSLDYGLNASATIFDGENKYIRITDIDDKFNNFIDTNITSPDVDLLIYNDYLLKEGDILFARTGASVGKTYKYNKKDGKVYFAGFLIRARIKSEFDSNFIFQRTLTSDFKRFIKITSQRSGQPGVNAQEYCNYSFHLPSKKEQIKIGELLSQIDNLINLKHQELDTLKQTKEGFLQKMFPKEGETVPEVRFPGFFDNWEEKKIVDVISHLKSGLSRMLSNEDIGLPVIRANNIEAGILNLDSQIKYWYINDPQGSDTNNYLIQKDDILINFINSETKMGTAAIVETEPLRSTIYTTNILNLRTNENAYPYFIFLITMTKNYKNYIKIITKPAVNQASFTTVDFKNYSFLIPSLEEQIKISQFFKQLNKVIELKQREIDVLIEMKKGFLQKMFV